MGLGDILEILIPAFIIYQFFKGFGQNKKKAQEREETLNPAQPEPGRARQQPQQPENLNDIFQALFSDEGFSPESKQASPDSEKGEGSDPHTAHILGREVEKPLDNVDLDAPSERRDAVKFDHSKTRYEDEFARQKEFLSATDGPQTAGGHDYFEEEINSDLFDQNHGFGALSSTKNSPVATTEQHVEQSFVNGLFSDPQSLQKAVVMKEVLDRPVSQRRR